MHFPTSLFHVPGHVAQLLARDIVKEHKIPLQVATFRIWEHQALAKRELARQEKRKKAREKEIGLRPFLEEPRHVMLGKPVGKPIMRFD